MTRGQQRKVYISVNSERLTGPEVEAARDFMRTKITGYLGENWIEIPAYYDYMYSDYSGVHPTIPLANSIKYLGQCTHFFCQANYADDWRASLEHGLAQHYGKDIFLVEVHDARS